MIGRFAYWDCQKEGHALQDLREQEIYQTAIRVFAENGFEKTTMEGIAAQAKVAKGTLFYRYNNKEELFVQIVQYALKRVFESSQEALADIAKPGDKLAVILAVQIGLAAQNPNMAKLIFREAWGAIEQHPPLREQLEAYLQYIEVIVAEGVQSGELRTLDSRQVAMAMFWMVASATFSLTYEPDRHDPRQLADEVTRQFLTGIQGEISHAH